MHPTLSFIFPIWIHGWKLVVVILLLLNGLRMIYKWWKIVGSMRDLFGDPNRSEATRRLLFPGLFWTILCLVLIIIPSRPKSIHADGHGSSFSYIYATNGSSLSGRFEINSQVEYFDPHETRRFEVTYDEVPPIMKGYLEDEVVFEQQVGMGCSIANLSEDMCILAMPVIYGAGGYGEEDAAPVYLCEAGCKPFSEYRSTRVYGVGQTAPEKIEVWVGANGVTSFEIKVMTFGELMVKGLSGE